MSAARSSYLFLSLALLVLLSSCTIMKRHYTSGFYLSSSKEAKTHPVVNSTVKEKKHSREKMIEVVTKELVAISHSQQIQPERELIASSKNETPQIKALSPACDTVFLKDGTVIAAKVTEITSDRIKFRYCSGADKAERSVPKREVDHIAYPNGTIERFDAIPRQSFPVTQQPQEVNGFAVAGFIFSLLFYPILLVTIFAAISAAVYSSFLILIIGAVLFYLMGLIFSIVGIVQISKNREKYTGLALAIIGLIISLIPFIILAANSFKI